jgi:L,D-peptidoglycan transpeptidase YkuD (ErfK/YbiS/YcfS/YnhG family)
MLRLTVLSACVALCVAAPAHARQTVAHGCPATIADQIPGTASAKQLVTVVAPSRSSTQGLLQLWRKAEACWVVVDGPWTAWLGRRGVSPDKREGDRKTPAGLYGIGRMMYGIAPNPGVRFRYHRIVCGDWWVEDPRSAHYNRFHHVRCGTQPPFHMVSEDLSRSPTAYRHFAVIRYNDDPVVPGRGSGIFLHASTGRPTLGCVSLPLARLVAVLRWLRPANAPLIAIGTRADLRRLTRPA